MFVPFFHSDELVLENARGLEHVGQTHTGGVEP
eukprot:CAMPEP_0184210256 /NCGR_PEP_ID=MMETSP0976-20121227/12520_1 /TAXON_ID=483370 /ORGANISM="non described non described, Strain CCMP2097" /LENGTH=32 /DNA_ID= /DNA_START= /DNA_END= /DNA_ORIENTATION=